MVLQNKYKARASAKHNKGRGGGEGRGRGRGRGGAHGHERGRPLEDEEGIEVPDSEPEEFPSLGQAAEKDAERSGDSEAEEEAEETRRQRQKYGKRKIESNAWKFQQDVKDPYAEESEPEPEVDLTNLIERVKQLDSGKNAKVTAVSNAQDEEEARRIEEDIDHSLSYLLHKERQRQKGKGKGFQDDELSAKPHEQKEMTEEERKRDAEEREEMLKERERTEALRALKERFQGHAIGERPKEARKMVLQAGASGGAPSGTSFKLPAAKKDAALPAASRNMRHSDEKPKPQVESMQDFLDSMIG